MQSPINFASGIVLGGVASDIFFTEVKILTFWFYLKSYCVQLFLLFVGTVVHISSASSMPTISINVAKT